MRDLNFFSRKNLYKKIFIYTALSLFFILSLSFFNYKRLAMEKEYEKKISFLEEESNVKKEKDLTSLKKSLEKEEALVKNTFNRLIDKEFSSMDITNFLLLKSKQYIEIENIFLDSNKVDIRANSKGIRSILNYKKILEDRDGIYQVKLIEIKNNEDTYEFMISFNLEELYE